MLLFGPNLFYPGPAAIRVSYVGQKPELKERNG
jgi:hypothetical protein